MSQENTDVAEMPEEVLAEDEFSSDALLEEDFDDDGDDSDEEDDELERTANIGETSVEINIEELIAEFEAERAATGDCHSVARRRLEEILEEKRIARELRDMDGFDFDF